MVNESLRRLVFILLLFLFDPSEDYPLKNGRPTSKGIQQYVEDKADSLVRVYQQYVGDTLYNVWIYAEDLKAYEVHDSLELGRYYPNEIYINTDELFIAYEVADLKKSSRTNNEESNRFVKSTIFHELTHEYIYQISRQMLYVEHTGVHKAYQTFIWILRSHEAFGAEFIEEGICEYMTERMGEIIPPRRVPVPRTVEELTDKKNRYWITYKYASRYLKPFLDTAGFTRGIRILLYNPPPNFEEILQPDLFYGRLVIPPG